MDNQIKWTKIGLIALIVFAIASCKKVESPEIDGNKMGDFSIEFDNLVGDYGLQFDNMARPYVNAKGEPFTISRIQYFISNIKVKKTDGSEYVVPQDPVEESYFLIFGDDRNSRFAKVKVPEGDYTQVSFILGVDSLRSTMGLDKRTGVLDPTAGDHETQGMYWGWNSGYIFFKLEGNSAVISDDQQGDPTGRKQFKYHIGGFGGYNAPTLNNLKTITIDLTKAGIAQVRNGYRSNVHLFVDLMKVFNGPNAFRIAEHPNVMFSEYSQNIANNFPTMFSHDHTENGVTSEDQL